MFYGLDKIWQFLKENLRKSQKYIRINQKNKTKMAI